jgi:hypothetical protein
MFNKGLFFFYLVLLIYIYFKYKRYWEKTNIIIIILLLLGYLQKGVWWEYIEKSKKFIFIFQN